MQERHKGYYSIVQYQPDSSRLEVVNVGVVLLCPSLGFLQARTQPNDKRIRAFFHFHQEAKEHRWLKHNLEALEYRLEVERDKLIDPEAWGNFVATRGGEVRLSPPRWVSVVEPREKLDALFNELVVTPSEHKRAVAPRPTDRTVRTHVETLLNNKSFLNRMARDIELSSPVSLKPLKVPFAYQNGRYNLLEPKLFTERNAEQTAALLGIQGSYHYHHPHPDHGDLQLVVVGDVSEIRQPEIREVITSTFAEQHVKFFDLADPEPLLEHIEHGLH